MSITLVTGVPGSGKTLWTVDYMEKLRKSGRRIVVDGIRDLAIEHELVDETWLKEWHRKAQAQDVIVVDEAQRVWPPVSVSVKPGEDIEKLHIHRHLGVDFVLITQHPQRINKNIRDLVGRHVHVRRLFGMQRAMLYEWDHCHNVGSLRDAVKSQWAFPKSVYKLYTSAEVHTKQKAVIPKALFVIPVAILAAVVFGWRSYGMLHHGVGVVDQKGAQSRPGVQVGASGVGSAGGSVGAGSGVSAVWRIAGRYAVGGRRFVVLVDEAGRMRVEGAAAFAGDGESLRGSVGNDAVAVWSGSAPGGVAGGAK